jgi:hypothetical protein
VHEADEPNALVDFLDADPLAGQDDGDDDRRVYPLVVFTRQLGNRAAPVRSRARAGGSITTSGSRFSAPLICRPSKFPCAIFQVPPWSA